MRIGIIGASGFIGSHLMRRLKEQNDFEVAVFNGDLFNISDIDNFFNDNIGMSQLVNLAGIFSGDFEQLFSVNVTALHNLLSVAVKHDIKRIVHISTGAVYGEPDNGKSKEGDELRPNTLYGLSKMYGEECLEYYSRLHKFDFVILRFPNVYGPGNNKGVIYNFIDSIKRENKVVIFGDGEQKRNFLYVDDSVAAIISALSHGAGSQIFNIADKDIHSLNDLVNIIKKIKPGFVIEYKAADASNNLQVLSEDISKAKKSLYWKPLVGLDTGIRNVLKNDN